MQPPNPHQPASLTRKQRKQWFIVGAYAVLLLVVSLLPGQSLPSIPDWFSLFSRDKVAHFGAYGVFALLLSAAISEHQVKGAVLWAILIAAIFGAFAEVLQGISGTGRHFDPVDMMANLLGAMLGGTVFWLRQLLK